MINGQQQHPSIDGRAEATVTLSVNQWNLIITLLGLAPWREANPHIGELARQINPQIEAMQGGEPRVKPEGTFPN